MSGTKAGGEKVAKKLLARDKDYFANIGRKGGKAPHSGPVGFAAMDKDKHLAASLKGGENSENRRKAQS